MYTYHDLVVALTAMVAREMFEKCTVAMPGVPCGLTRHPKHGMGKMASNML